MTKLLALLFLLAAHGGWGKPLPWIPFNWEGGTLAGRHFDKAGITVPVTLDNLPHKFKMQLDLGTLTTTVYGNAIALYLAEYPALKARLDTTRTFYIENQKNPMLVRFKLQLGPVDFGVRNLGYFQKFGDQLAAQTPTDKAEVHVGTLAPDLFQNRVLIIDYPHQRLCVVDQVPTAYAKASFQPFKKNGRIKIPLRINGQPEDLLFDTGSSLFALLTTRQRAVAVATEAVQASIKTSSWGEYYYVYGRRPEGTIYFGNQQLPSALVFADNLQHRFDKLYEQENIWGITGNTYFLHNMVIIDYKTTFIACNNP